MAEKVKVEEIKAVEPVAEEVKVAPVKHIVVKEKMVKVVPKFSGKRNIGGVWYDFTLDKETEVSEDAKRSLKQAGAIYL